MADSNSSGVKHRTYREIAEMPVTWGKLMKIFAAVGGVLTTATLFVWGNDRSHEAAQNSAIAAKADRVELSQSVENVATEVRLLRSDVNTLVLKLIKVAEAGPVGPGQAQAQGQRQEVRVVDAFSDAVQRDFILRERERLAQENEK